MVKSAETRMPTARAIAMSSTPARIIAPRRVRSISSHSPIATRPRSPRSAPAGTSGRRGRRRAAAAAATPASGPGSGRRPTPMRQKSAMMNAMPSVASTWASTLPASAAARSARRARRRPRRASPRQRRREPEGSARPGAPRRRRRRPSMKRAPCVMFGDPHQPEDEREARREQEQQPAEGEAVEGLYGPELHRDGRPGVRPSRSDCSRRRRQDSRFFAGGHSRE